MQLVTIFVATTATRPSAYRRGIADSLRRAGYADGERQPRIKRHWANR